VTEPLPIEPGAGPTPLASETGNLADRLLEAFGTEETPPMGDSATATVPADAQTSTDPASASVEAGDQPSEDIFEIPGVGSFTKAELESAKEAQTKLADVDGREAALNERMGQLEAREARFESARTMSDLLQIPEFRQRVESVIDELIENKSASPKDGKTLDLSRFRDSRLDEMLPDIQTVRQMAVQQQHAAHFANLDKMRDGFKEQFGETVTNDAWDAVLKEAFEAHGDAIDYPHVELAAFKAFSGKAMTAKVQSAVAQAAKPGTRISIVPKPPTNQPAPAAAPSNGRPQSTYQKMLEAWGG